MPPGCRRFASPAGESGRSPLRPVWCMRLLCGVLVDAANALPTFNRTSDDRTSGNRAITEEMSANPRLSGQVDPMSDD
jgi:hypothetical protein